MTRTSGTTNPAFPFDPHGGRYVGRHRDSSGRGRRRTASGRLDLFTRRRISAANLLEAAIVRQARFCDAGGRELDILIHRLAIDSISVTVQHVEIARSAFWRFGKGRHPAGLNFGDCFAYALSKLWPNLFFSWEQTSQRRTSSARSVVTALESAGEFITVVT